MKRTIFFIMLALIASSAIAGPSAIWYKPQPSFSLEVRTADSTITATDCTDIHGLQWIEPSSRHSGVISAKNCNNITSEAASNTSPVNGQHALTVDIYDNSSQLFVECALIEFYRPNAYTTHFTVYCQDSPNMARKP